MTHLDRNNNSQGQARTYGSRDKRTGIVDQTTKTLHGQHVRACFVINEVNPDDYNWDGKQTIEKHPIRLKTMSQPTMLSSVLQLAIAPGPLGIGISRKKDDGSCVVRKKINKQSPFEVGDIILGFNGVSLNKVEGGVPGWVALFQRYANVQKNVVIRRWTPYSEATVAATTVVSNNTVDDDDKQRNIHWVNVVRESKLTETIASQIIRDTTAFHHHKTNPSIRPYASDNFKLYPKVFCIKQVNRSEVHKVCVLQDMLEAVQKISHDDFVYVCPVSLNRLGNSKQQIDFFVKTLQAGHPHAYLMPLREFGIPLETLTAQLDKYEADRKAVSEVTTKNDQGKSVQVMDGYDDEREEVEQVAKKVYSDFCCDGKEYLKELCESGLKNAKAHIVDSGFEQQWLSIQKMLEQGMAYNILDSIVTTFGNGKGEVEKEEVIGLLARSSPGTAGAARPGRVRVIYGVPIKQMSYMISHMKYIYGEKNFTKLKIMIFYDADHSGYSYTNTEFVRFMDLFRSGIFSKVFMSSPTRASRKSAPVKSIEYIKEKTNTEVHYSKHIGQDVNELVRKEEERQQGNKLATLRWNDFVSDQRARLPTETNSGLITRDVSSFMMKISNTYVTKEIRERFADDIKRFTSVGNSDVIKTTTAWGDDDDDDDDSSVESANMEEEGT